MEAPDRLAERHRAKFTICYKSFESENGWVLSRYEKVKWKNSRNEDVGTVSNGSAAKRQTILCLSHSKISDFASEGEYVRKSIDNFFISLFQTRK